MSQLPDISVVVVNWNHVRELLPCLASLYDDGAAEQQVVLVDNGSSDGSVAHVRREFPAVEIIETGANLGFAEGCNRGIDAARGGWVLALNNDALLLPGGLQRLRTLAREAAPEVGMLQPTVLFKDRPHHLNSTGIQLLSHGWAIDRDCCQIEPRAAQPGEIFACTAGAGLYRRAMLEDVRLTSGVFDRTYFMYFEDVDLGWRCRLAGWRAMYEPSVRVAHRYQGSSLRHGPNWVARMCQRNRVRTLLKNGSTRLIVRAGPSLAGVAGYALLRGRDRGDRILESFRDGWRQRSEVEVRVRVPRHEVEARWIG